MPTLRLVAPWGFRPLTRYRPTERDEYLRIRRTRGHEAAEDWRTSWRCLNPTGLLGFVLPPATWETVRRRFGKYAARYETLTELEQFVVVGVMEERKEDERRRRMG